MSQDQVQLEERKIVIEDDRDKMVVQTRAERKTGMEAKRGIIAKWHEIEDAYYGSQKKSLTSRFNVPFPFMSGFIDTFKSKIDDPFVLKFEDTREAGYRSALKVQAYYEQESKDEDNDWESIDLETKQTALLYGRGINKAYPEVTDKGFKFCVEHTDPYDFYDNPIIGAALEAHNFCGQDNIFRDKYQLMAQAKLGYYSATQVQKLINATPDKALSINDELYAAKQNRLFAIGKDNKTYDYAGSGMYRLVESGTTFQGVRYLVTWNPETGIWLRVEKLSKVLESGLWPWTSWSPKREAHNSWPIGPANDFLPVAVAMSVFLNQELDNRNKKNWNMRAYDPDMFPNPAEFEWRPDGLVAIKSGATKTRKIEDGIYKFDTADLTGTINMIDYLDNLTGTKLGITNASQGQAKEEKVGIFFGNQQAVADRIEATSKQYRKNWVAIGRRFVWGVYQYLPEPQAVKVLGEKGLEWDKLRKNEVDPTLKIRVEGGNVQAQMDEIKAKKRSDALGRIAADQQLQSQINPKWRAEQELRTAEIPPEEIAEAMDVQNYGNKELMSEAAEAIEELIAGRQPKLNYGANTAFIRKIMDFAYDNDVKHHIFDRLIAYANAHMDIAARNAARAQSLMAAEQGGEVDMGMGSDGLPLTGADTLMPTSTNQQSGQLTEAATPAMPVMA